MLVCAAVSRGRAAAGNRLGSCWIATDGAIGNEKQCLALAHYLGISPEVFRIELRSPWEQFAPLLRWRPGAALKGDLETTFRRPPPDLMITCGRRSTLASLAVKAAAGRRTTTVHVLDPRIAPANFDWVVCPLHDGLAGPNVITTRGALHRIDHETLAGARETWAPRLGDLPEPRIVVLIGASNRAYRIDRAYLDRLYRSAARLAGDGSLLVTTSRRTPSDLRSYVAERFSGPRAVVWTDSDGDANPYLGFLAWADRIVVSADSVNMVSESLGTGKPVHCTPPGPGNRKFRRFHRALTGAGMLLALDSAASLAYAPLRETAAVAARIAAARPRS